MDCTVGCAYRVHPANMGRRVEPAGLTQVARPRRQPRRTVVEGAAEVRSVRHAGPVRSGRVTCALPLSTAALTHSAVCLSVPKP